MALFRVRPMRPGERRSWDPWREMEELRRELERIAERAGGSVPSGGAAGLAFAPEVDLYDAGAAFVLKLDLPAVRQEDLEVSIEGRILAIRGLRAADEVGEERYLYRERPAGQFARAIELPEGVDVQNARATLRRGVLEIVLPKSRAALPQKVTVAVNQGD